MTRKTILSTEDEDKITGLLSAFTAGQSILEQEATGQSRFVKSELLPIKNNAYAKDAKPTPEIYEAMGIKVNGQADDIFYSATLPDGWKKVATDHSMWSRLLDGKGNERATIFYKAAFYDRHAHINFNTRYFYIIGTVDNPRGYTFDDTVPQVGYVMRGDGVVFQTAPLTAETYYYAQDALSSQVKAYLDDRFPDWKNPAAYWEE